MPHTEDMAIFVRVIGLGSLSAPGAHMRMSPAVVNNQIAGHDLADLGIRLLHGPRGRVNPTEEGGPSAGTLRRHPGTNSAGRAC